MPLRRKFRRFDVRAPVYYRWVGAWGEGTTYNVSLGGLLVERAPDTVEVGSEVHMWCSFFPGSTECALDGRVVRRTETGFAVEFVGLRDEQLDLLRRALPDSAVAEPSYPGGAG